MNAEQKRSDEIVRRERAESVAETLKALRVGTSTGALSSPTSIAALFDQVKETTTTGKLGSDPNVGTDTTASKMTAADMLLQLANAAAS